MNADNSARPQPGRQHLDQASAHLLLLQAALPGPGETQRASDKPGAADATVLRYLALRAWAANSRHLPASAASIADAIALHREHILDHAECAFPSPYLQRRQRARQGR